MPHNHAVTAVAAMKRGSKVGSSQRRRSWEANNASAGSAMATATRDATDRISKADLPRKAYYMKPEIFAGANHCHVLVQICRFLYVTVGVEVVNARDVALGFGCSENDNGDATQTFVL